LVERLLYTQDVGGSSPSPPTSLRACGASAGKPVLSAKAARRSPKGEDGLNTDEICLSTAEHRPPGRDICRIDGRSQGQVRCDWRLVTYIAFSDDQKAADFERYLKSASGRAFANKRFR
jgi:hypothetical protein